MQEAVGKTLSIDFKKASQNRMFQDVVEQIQEAILEGRLEPGTRLPSERKLQETFSASRGTLREALRVLEQKGLITIKTGVKGGAVVNALTTDQISQSLDLLIRYQRVSLRDLAEFREGVEGNVACLAVERALPEDIDRLKNLLQEAGDHLKKGASGWDDFICTDNEIHIQLARIAGNPIYLSVLRTIYSSIQKYFDKFLPRREELLHKNYSDLCEIVEAVEKRQASRVHLLVQTHVYRFNRIMEENSQQDSS
jgi:GntR family transcriptional regulator, transcriptional repressor for pyruvate dehydrogenase complex